MQVPELQNYPLEQMKLKIEAERWEEILVQKWGFTSLKKIFDELKKKATQPQQLGLF